VVLSDWFWAIYRLGQGKKGISPLQLSKEIGVSYPTAWLMAHKIRKAMADREQGRQLRGIPGQTVLGLSPSRASEAEPKACSVGPCRIAALPG